MKKIFFSIALATVLFTTTSGFNEERFDSVPCAMAPHFSVENQQQSVNIGGASDSYVLLTFWESSDAMSRTANGQYQAIARDADNVTGLGINFDESSVLFEEIVKADGLDAASQFRVSDELADNLRRLYALGDGMGSVLIDPRGRIMTFNPSAEYLKSLKKS